MMPIIKPIYIQQQQQQQQKLDINKNSFFFD